MVVEHIRYQVADDRCQACSEAYARAAEVLDADGHCLSYDVAQGVEEPANWVVRVEWHSVEGHEQGFRKAPHRESFAAVRPFVDDIREMQHYDVRLTSG